MEFHLSVHIERSPDDVFAFLRDKDKYPQKEGSPVLALDQTTPGPPGVGTRYREVVQMLPFVQAEIRSEITAFEPGRYLAEDWAGGGMEGDLAYEFLPEKGGTRLVQKETVRARGLLKLLAPLIRLALRRALESRLLEVKRVLESG